MLSQLRGVRVCFSNVDLLRNEMNGVPYDPYFEVYGVPFDPYFEVYAVPYDPNSELYGVP